MRDNENYENCGEHRVVVGGSPATPDELRALVDGRLQLRLIHGTDRRTSRDAGADLVWANIIVVWGGTQLDHKVSKLYTDGKHGHVTTCARRGIAALAETPIRKAFRQAELKARGRR